MVISIEIKPNRFSRFLGHTIGRVSRTVGAGVKGFKTEARKEWNRLSPTKPRKAAAAALTA